MIWVISIIALMIATMIWLSHLSNQINRLDISVNRIKWQQTEMFKFITTGEKPEFKIKGDY